MKNHILPLLLVLSLSSASVFAHEEAKITDRAYYSAFVTLYAGTPVYLTLNQEVSSADVEVGHTVDFLVRSNVTVGGKVLIAAGSIAEGRVTKVVKSCGRRCNERCAEVAIAAESVQAVDGQRIYLRGVPYEVKADCFSDTPAVANVGEPVSSRILNNVKINA
ncbi:MAG: hypothetical protein H6558_08180 [Lewinellaceae bacterium]|nr:hypothetical protein [Lewinellaceae bacterium]